VTGLPPEMVLVIGGPMDGQLIPPPPDGITEATFTADFHIVAPGLTQEQAIDGVDLEKPDGQMQYRLTTLADPVYSEVTHKLVVPADVPEADVKSYALSGLLRNAMTLAGPPEQSSGTFATFGVGYEPDGDDTVIYANLHWFSQLANGKMPETPTDVVRREARLNTAKMKAEVEKHGNDKVMTDGARLALDRLFTYLRDRIITQWRKEV